MMHSKTKHIAINYHYLREQLRAKEVKLDYVPTKEHVVDIFGKPLPKDMFDYLRDSLGIVPLPRMN